MAAAAWICERNTALCHMLNVGGGCSALGTQHLPSQPLMPYAIGQGGVIESRFGGPSHRRLGFPYWGQTRTGRWLVGVRGSVRALSGHCRTGQSWLRPLALSW